MDCGPLLVQFCLVQDLFRRFSSSGTKKKRPLFLNPTCCPLSFPVNHSQKDAVCSITLQKPAFIFTLDKPSSDLIFCLYILSSCFCVFSTFSESRTHVYFYARCVFADHFAACCVWDCFQQEILAEEERVREAMVETDPNERMCIP